MDVGLQHVQTRLEILLHLRVHLFAPTRHVGVRNVPLPVAAVQQLVRLVVALLLRKAEPPAEDGDQILAMADALSEISQSFPRHYAPALARLHSRARGDTRECRSACLRSASSSCQYWLAVRDLQRKDLGHETLYLLDRLVLYHVLR